LKNFNRRQISSDDVDEYKNQVLKILRACYEKLNGHTAAVQSQYEDHYEKTHREVEFEVDDEIMVYFPYRKRDSATNYYPDGMGRFELYRRPIVWHIEWDEIPERSFKHC
jgi:hypothetical protein